MDAMWIGVVAGRKVNGPWKVAFLAITTAIQQATHAAEHTTQSNAWSHHIGQPPQGKFLKPGVQNSSQRSPNQAAVVYEATLPYHENLGNGLPGKLLAPV